jgi:DNA-binding Lrp family transcriptional regulator
MKTDNEILETIQDGIPITREPYRDAAEKLGITEKELIERLKDMKNRGVIRRFSANINQRKLGITANAVVVWSIPEQLINSAVTVFLKHSELSHIYERKIVPNRWEYNLYTVVHDYNQESVAQTIEKIADEIGIHSFQVLFSKRRFKGTSSRLESRREEE